MRGAGVLRRVDEGSTGTQHDTKNVRFGEEALPRLVYLILPGDAVDGVDDDADEALCQLRLTCQLCILYY